MADMEEAYVEKSVRTRLILAGITELEEHGLGDFSLRRAALAAQVSCAAPYRHFKDKDEYIREIITHVATLSARQAVPSGQSSEQ